MRYTAITDDVSGGAGLHLEHQRKQAAPRVARVRSERLGRRRCSWDLSQFRPRESTDGRVVADEGLPLCLQPCAQRRSRGPQSDRPNAAERLALALARISDRLTHGRWHTPGDLE